MKTLNQIEPRTDVLTLTNDGNSRFTIQQPGSYYLTTNIVGVASKHGINISSGDVTLDLNGFGILGVSNSLKGVNCTGSYTNITVRNGVVRGWGNNGVDIYSSGFPKNILLEHLTVSHNQTGILTEESSIVRDCLSLSNRVDGIFCRNGLISDCTSANNVVRGINAINSIVRDCRINSSGGDGINANNSTVRDCEINSSGGNGIIVRVGSVSSCVVKDSVLSGIYVELPGCKIIGNTGNGNNKGGTSSHAGIFINDSNNRIEDNHFVTSGHAGIKVSGISDNNVIIKNSVSGNTNILANNYIILGNNALGPLISAFGTITNSNPWANFSY